MEGFRQKVSAEIFEQKYCLNGEKSKEEVFVGIAADIALAEDTPEKVQEWENKFKQVMLDGHFYPGGRIMANARIDTKMRYYNNCYTIGIGDSIEEIYTSILEDAKISATGGGVGLNISGLRPKDAIITKGGESSGPLSFLKVFNTSAKTIHTGGNRRAAHIAILNCDHPDIEEFITCKQGDKNKELTQFNISVGVTDAFMDAVDNDLDWDLVFDGKVYKTIKAQYLYDLITENSYIHNEPGLFHLDTVQRYNNGYWAFIMDRVNPCGF
jgi:ribonucleoside-diphosphate reductase alpha chain